MTDQELADVLRRLHETLTFQRFGFQSMDCAAIERAIELLEREARMEGSPQLAALKRQDALDDGIVT